MRGEWKRAIGESGPIIWDEDMTIIAYVTVASQANLIAAAPNLLSAAEEVLAKLEYANGDFEEECSLLESAILKAKGVRR